MKKRLPYYMIHILTLCLGVFLYCNPLLSINVFSQILGVALIVYAILRSITMFLARERETLFTLGLIVNIAIIVMGILMISNSFNISAVISLILGIYVLLNAIWRLRVAFAAKKVNLPIWYLPIFISLLNIVLAAIILSNLASIATVSIKIMAIAIVCNSVLNLLSLIYHFSIEKQKIRNKNKSAK